MTDYLAPSRPVANAPAETRGAFINRTYMHLFGAIAFFFLVETYLFKSGIALPLTQWMMGIGWLFILGGFMVVSWIATRVAHTVDSVPAQYAALGGFVIAEAIIFCPMLYIAQTQMPGVIDSAAWATLIAFGGLTAIAFVTGKDFSFLRSFLMWGGFAALGLIVLGTIFGFNLGTFFTVAMIGFAGAAILYDTSNILHHYPEDRHVAAALQLFGSVALMFWYVLRFFMAMSGDD